MKLWASSTASDTDFTAKLVDVYPPSKDFPGFDLGVQDGVVRARYRNSLEHAELMKPGQIYPISIEMYPTAMIFQKGHRIRVDISSSNFPRFDPNPNTGEHLNDNRQWRIAVNTIYNDHEHPSHIVLPGRADIVSQVGNLWFRVRNGECKVKPRPSYIIMMPQGGTHASSLPFVLVGDPVASSRLFLTGITLARKPSTPPTT